MRSAAGPRRAARLAAPTAGVLLAALAQGSGFASPTGQQAGQGGTTSVTSAAAPARTTTAGAPAPRTEGAPAAPVAPRAGATGCPPPPTGSLDPRRLPKPPAGATVSTHTPTSACTYVVGYATVTKLRGAMVINDPRRRPAMASLGVNARTVIDAATGYFETDTIGEFRQPVSESTFLGFGIEPVTAEVSYENAPLTITSVQAATGAPTVTTIGYTTTLHLGRVRVNGVPLDVGPTCRARGADIELVGRSDQGYQLIGDGGPMKGTIDIPPFTGCGSPGEDLDPLLTGMVSGAHNYLDVAQSPLCSAACQNQTPPKLPAH